MSIRTRILLLTYRDEDDLLAVYSSPFVHELEDFCGLVLDVGGRLLSLEIGLCGEGGWRGCHWSGRGHGSGSEEGRARRLRDIEKVDRTSEWCGHGAAMADG